MTLTSVVAGLLCYEWVWLLFLPLEVWIMEAVLVCSWYITVSDGYTPTNSFRVHVEHDGPDSAAFCSIQSSHAQFGDPLDFQHLPRVA